MEAISGKIGNYKYEVQETLLARVGLTNLALLALSTGVLVCRQKLTENRILPFQGSLKATLCYGALQIGLFASSHAYHSRYGTPLQVKDLKHQYSRASRGLLRSVVMTVALVSIGAVGKKCIERWKGKIVSPLGLSSHQFLACQSVASAVFSLAVFAREERFSGFENQGQAAQKERLTGMSDNDFLDCLTLFSDIQRDDEIAARLQKVKAWDLISKAESVLQNSGGLEMQLILVEQGFIEEAYRKAQIMPIDKGLLRSFLFRLESEAINLAAADLGLNQENFQQNEERIMNAAQQELSFVREAKEISQTIPAEYQEVADFLKKLRSKAEGLVEQNSLKQSFVDKAFQEVLQETFVSSSNFPPNTDPLLPEPFGMVGKRLAYNQIYGKIAVECASQGKLEIAQWYAGRIGNSLSRLKIQIEISDGADMKDLSAEIYSACKANLNPASHEEKMIQISNALYFNGTDPIHKLEECIKLFWEKGMKLKNEHDLGLVDPYWKFFEVLTTLSIEANTNAIHIERNQDHSYSLNRIDESIAQEKLEELQQALNRIENPNDVFRALIKLSSFSDEAVHLAETSLEVSHKRFTLYDLKAQVRATTDRLLAQGNVRKPKLIEFESWLHIVRGGDIRLEEGDGPAHLLSDVLEPEVLAEIQAVLNGNGPPLSRKAINDAIRSKRGFPRPLIQSFCKVYARLDRNKAIQWAERFYGHALADEWYLWDDMNLISELIVEDEGLDFDALNRKLNEYGETHVKAALLKTFIRARAPTNLEEAWRAYLKFKELRLECPPPDDQLYPSFHTNRCLDNLREIVKYGMNEEIYQEVKLLLQTSDDTAPPMIPARYHKRISIFFDSCAPFFESVSKYYPQKLRDLFRTFDPIFKPFIPAFDHPLFLGVSAFNTLLAKGKDKYTIASLRGRLETL